MLRKSIFTLAAAAAFLLGAAGEARAENVLKFGSLAPAQSPWAQVLKVWERAVKEKSNGNLILRFYWGGTQGDEASMVGKIKSGQLDGAALTAVGLGKIHKPILAIQMPGVFRSWEKLDAARVALKNEFQGQADGKGFVILGWGDVGRMHWFSKGFEIAGPDSLRGQKPYVWRDDDINRAVFQTIGGVTPVPLGVPEVLPNLNTGAVNAIHTPALTCEQLQWASHFDHIVVDSHGMMVGALVVAKSKLDSLPGDQKQILADTGAVAASELTGRIRGEDNAAQKRLEGKMKVHKLSDAENGAWMQLYSTVRQRLGQQGVFPAALIAQIERHGG
jgi:TRAP-type C4-dicarboxylate transport system substrate-binding protein